MKFANIMICCWLMLGLSPLGIDLLSAASSPEKDGKKTKKKSSKIVTKVTFGPIKDFDMTKKFDGLRKFFRNRNLIYFEMIRPFFERSGYVDVVRRASSRYSFCSLLSVITTEEYDEEVFDVPVGLVKDNVKVLAKEKVSIAGKSVFLYKMEHVNGVSRYLKWITSFEANDETVILAGIFPGFREGTIGKQLRRAILFSKVTSE